MSRTVPVRPNLSDEEFLSLYRECGENKAEVARRVGVTEGAIRKRLKKVLGDSSKQDGQARAVAAIGRQLARTEEEPEGAEDGIRVMTLLLDSNRTFKAVLADIQRDVEERKGKIRPFERDTLLKISQRQEQLAKTYCEIQSKLLSAKSVHTILSAILQEVAREIPDIHERVVYRLRDAGLLGEILGWLDPSPRRP